MHPHLEIVHIEDLEALFFLIKALKKVSPRRADLFPPPSSRIFLIEVLAVFSLAEWHKIFFLLFHRRRFDFLYHGSVGSIDPHTKEMAAQELTVLSFVKDSEVFSPTKSRRFKLS